MVTPAAGLLIQALESKKFAQTAKNLMNVTNSLNEVSASGGLQNLENSFMHLKGAELGLLPFKTSLELLSASTMQSGAELFKANLELMQNPVVQTTMEKLSNLLNLIINNGTDLSKNLNTLITNLEDLGVVSADATTKVNPFLDSLEKTLLPFGTLNALLSGLNTVLANSPEFLEGVRDGFVDMLNHIIESLNSVLAYLGIPTIPLLDTGTTVTVPVGGINPIGPGLGGGGLSQ